MKRVTPGALVVLFVGALAMLPKAAQAVFGYRKTVTIDRSKLGLDGTAPTTLSSYPMLFNVTDTDLKSTANSGQVTSASGYDIVFRATDTTTCAGPAKCTLDHELEYYGPTTGDVVAWVRLPSVNTQTASSNTVIYVYYGQSSITTSTEKKNCGGGTESCVWDTNFKGVFHHGTGSGTTAFDSANSATNGTMGTGAIWTATSGGKAGYGIDFNGTTTATNNMGAQTKFNMTTALSVEGWVKTDVTTGIHRIFIHAPIGGPPYEEYTLVGTDLASGFKIRASVSGDGTLAYVDATTTMSTATWYYMASTWDATTLRVYIDGVQNTTVAESGTITDNNSSTTIGYDTLNNYNWDGIIDEVRVSAIARSNHWIKTVYNNINSPSTFYSVGSQTSSPTSLIDIKTFDALRGNRGVMLGWTTGYEADNLGFHIYRERPAGLERLTRSFIAGSALFTGSGSLASGRSYAWADYDDRGAPGETIRYWVEDIDISGKSVMHGPVVAAAVGDPGVVQTASAAVLEKPGAASSPFENTLAGDRGSISFPLPARFRDATAVSGNRLMADEVATRGLTAVQWGLAARADAIKLTVNREGFYRVNQPQLLAVGLDQAVDPRKLRLFERGREIAIIVNGADDGRLDAGDSVEFFASGADTPSTDSLIYWLIPGGAASAQGRRVPPVGRNVIPAPGAVATGFPLTVQRKDRSLYVAALKNGDSDNFFGAAVVPGKPVQQPIFARHAGNAISCGEPAAFEATFQGLTDVGHSVDVSLAGTPLGSVDFSGRSLASGRMVIDRALLREGENVFVLTAKGGDKDVSLVESLRLTYCHAPLADDNQLRLFADGAQPWKVGGFSGGGVRAFDVSDPRRVIEMPAVVEAAGGDYAASFAPLAAGPRVLWALAPDRFLSPAGIEANHASAWHDARGVDLLIVSHADFLPAVEPLRALREQQGLTAAVVDIADVYDEFGFGGKSPQALRAFFRRALTVWKHAPRFVLLVGDASMDPRNSLGRGSYDFVPTKLVDTQFLETASDDWFTDFDGQGRALIPVGRLPVRTAAEAQLVVSKIIAQGMGASGLDKKTVVLIADKSDTSFDFAQAARSMQLLMPDTLRAQVILRDQIQPDILSKTVLGALGAGPLLVDYVGHGSQASWSAKMLDATSAAALTNRVASAYASMTCLNGFFHDVYGPSLAEALLVRAQGGAMAVWASSGLTDLDPESAMNKVFIQAALRDGLPLGTAALRAKAAEPDPDVRRTWILFGDPSARITAPIVVRAESGGSFDGSHHAGGCAMVPGAATTDGTAGLLIAAMGILLAVRVRSPRLQRPVMRRPVLGGAGN